MSQLIEQLKRHEGFRAKPYFCTEGYLTIGYGTNLDSRGITKSEAKQVLENDVSAILSHLRDKSFFADLNDARQAVVINMCYQLGVNGFSKFKQTIILINLGNYEAAAKEMLDSKWAEQTPSRAKELSEQMRTGEFL